MSGPDANEEALAVFMEARLRQGCLPSTLATDARLVRAALRALSKPAVAVEADDLLRYVAGRAGRVRGTTLNRGLSALKAFFAALLEAGAIPSDPASSLAERRQ